MKNRRALRPFAAGLLLVLLFAATGCGGELDYRPSAIGQEGVITVVTDSSTWSGEVGQALRDQLSAYIATLPAPEPAFQIRSVHLTSQRDLDDLQKMKNVVIAAPLSDTTAVARFLKARLDEDAEEAIRSGQSAFVTRDDLWRRNQLVVYLIAADDEQLAESIGERGSDLRYLFNEITRRRVQVDMFEKGRQPDIEERLLAEHGFAVNAQHDYFVAVDTTDFVWLRRVLSDSWRSLYVHYVEGVDPSSLTPEWIYSTRDSLTQRYLQGNLGGWVEIDRRRPLETENINFLGRYGFETRGLWHMVGEEDGEIKPMGMGGPFLTYTFYDEATGRLYMIDGMVFAPGFEKREFLRQLEVIAHTFRTAEEAQTVAANVE